MNDLLKLVCVCSACLVLGLAGCQASAVPAAKAETDGAAAAKHDEPNADEGNQPAEPAKDAAAANEEDMPEHPFPNAVKAPSLEGGVAWINTAGPLDLKDLRGKFVLLDFWTYCCINCMHILPELKKLEEAYPNELVVIGVHSAKFETEEESQNIPEAVLRYEIEHPVVNDANHEIWNRYGVNSWPSLRVDRSRRQPRGRRQRRGGVRGARPLLQDGAAVLPEEGTARRDAAAVRPGGLRGRAQRRCGFPARCWPTRRASGCSSPTATTTAS